MQHTEPSTPLQPTRVLTYLLLFLFPLAGQTITHWYSALYQLLSIVALVALFQPQDRTLDRDERILLWALGLFFAAFVASAVINGWQKYHTRFLEVEIRYLLAIPVYLLLRRFDRAGTWLLRGVALGAVAIAGQALYDILVRELPRAFGIYSPNLLGPVAALYGFWLFFGWRLEPSANWRWVYWIGIPCSVTALVLSGSRGAYLGFLLMAIVAFSLPFSWRRLARSIGTILILIPVLYLGVPTVKDRVDLAIQQFETYRSATDLERLDETELGGAVRLEMWKAALRIFRDHPLVGVGRGGYKEAARQYVERGLAHPVAAAHSHPHNGFLEVMVSKGLLGLGTLMVLLIHPLLWFMRTMDINRGTALLGITHLVGLAGFTLTDASTFIKGNYVAVFLLFLTAFFAWHHGLTSANTAPTRAQRSSASSR